MMNIKSEFENYSTKHLGISSLKLHDYENSMTPYILEERELRATQMDIFSRLMMERIIWCAGPVDDRMSTFQEGEKVNNTLFELLGKYCGKTTKQVIKDATRDNWFSSSEALKYGIIDEVVTTRK